MTRRRPEHRHGTVPALPARLLGPAVPPVLAVVDEETAVVIPGSERASASGWHRG